MDPSAIQFLTVRGSTPTSPPAVFRSIRPSGRAVDNFDVTLRSLLTGKFGKPFPKRFSRRYVLKKDIKEDIGGPFHVRYGYKSPGRGLN
jgi:hypothetical protein